MKNEWRVLVGVCAIVIGVYAYAAYSGFMARPDQPAADAHYNQLAAGFQAGQLNLKVNVPAGLAQLANPYDPTASAPYLTPKSDLNDLSYYKGKLYLYFGVTPTVLLFWPFAALTGRYLYGGEAVVVFSTLGFLSCVGILCGLRRRYFPDANSWVVAASALALGLATGVPMLLPWSAVYQVAISCAYMLTMLALAAIWKALHEPERRGWWLAAASLAYGLALGARPSLLFGAVILLVPVVQAWRERGKMKILTLLTAATGPIILIGLGLMLYNALRFDNPFEFGWRYQLGGGQIAAQQFSLRYLWFNFRVYFLEPARWSRRFPFVHDITVPPLPVGYGRVEHPFGVLTNIPLVWLVLAVPLAWRGRSEDVRSTLCEFVATVVVLFGINTLIVSLFWAAINRYEVDFLPALVLLAVIGILSLDRTLADRPVPRRALRCTWGLLLGFSVAFNVLASIQRCADVYAYAGVVMRELGKTPEAIERFQQALRFDPGSAETHNDLGVAMEQAGRIPEATEQYEQALRIRPDIARAHFNLGVALVRQGRVQEAIGHYEQALRIKPDYADAHNNLGVALAQTGRIEEAVTHFQQALRIRPDYAEAHVDLGSALLAMSKIREAIGQYEEALRLRPDYVEAHFDLGFALEKLGRTPEAIEHYRQALKLRPDFTRAENALTRLEAGP